MFGSVFSRAVNYSVIEVKLTEEDLFPKRYIENLARSWVPVASNSAVVISFGG